jgi:ATP-dependent Clp protease adaptor protein ClpS
VLLAVVVFRSFYGSSEPDTPSHNDSIPSKPLRPQSMRIQPHFSSLLTVCAGLKSTLHPPSSHVFQLDIPAIMQNAVVVPTVRPLTKDDREEQHGRLFHVVLLDDDEHTYDYVVEMLQKLFLLPAHVALQHAIEVDTTGRTVVITCERPEAEFARDQIHAYGADPRMPKSKGPMSVVIIPAGDTALE